LLMTTKPPTKLCPRMHLESPDVCSNCVADLSDRVFKRRILGGAVEASGAWCEEVKQMGIFIDRLAARSNELYQLLKYVASCPSEVVDGEFAVFIPPKLFEKVIEAIG